MLRDFLIVSVLLAAIAVTCIVVFDDYQKPIVVEGPRSPVATKVKGDHDPNKKDDPANAPRPAEVSLFTELDSYTAWYLSRQPRHRIGLPSPKTVDFQNDQVVAILWGDKPTGGYEIALKATTIEETATIVTVITKVPRGEVDPNPVSPGIAVIASNGKRVRVVIAGDRFPERNGFTDFKEFRSLEYEVAIRPER